MVTKDIGAAPGNTGPHARRPASEKCRCGQDLDVTSRAHCPRCGSTLRAA